MTYRIEEVKDFEVEFNCVILYCDFTVYFAFAEISESWHYSNQDEKAEVYLNKVTTKSKHSSNSRSENLIGILREGAICEIERQFCTYIGNKYGVDCVFL